MSEKVSTEPVPVEVQAALDWMVAHGHDPKDAAELVTHGMASGLTAAQSTHLHAFL